MGRLITLKLFKRVAKILSGTSPSRSQSINKQKTSKSNVSMMTTSKMISSESKRSASKIFLPSKDRKTGLSCITRIKFQQRSCLCTSTFQGHHPIMLEITSTHVILSSRRSIMSRKKVDLSKKLYIYHLLVLSSLLINKRYHRR